MRAHNLQIFENIGLLFLNSYSRSFPCLKSTFALLFILFFLSFFHPLSSHLASFKGKSFIPFFGCTSKDLLFTMDGNPDHIQGSLNVLKICRVSEIIFDFKKGISLICSSIYRPFPFSRFIYLFIYILLLHFKLIFFFSPTGVIKSLPMIDQKSTTPREGGEKKRVEGWGLVHFQKMKDRDLEWWSRLGEPTDPNAKIRELVQVFYFMDRF